MTDNRPGFDEDTGTPRWVKVFAALFILLLLLVVIMILTGGHGPGIHAP